MACFQWSRRQERCSSQGAVAHGAAARERLPSRHHRVYPVCPDFALASLGLLWEARAPFCSPSSSVLSLINLTTSCLPGQPRTLLIILLQILSDANPNTGYIIANYFSSVLWTTLSSSAQQVTQNLHANVMFSDIITPLLLNFAKP